MNHIPATADELAFERLRRKQEHANAAAQSHLSSIQDHVDFTLQRAYFKCAYKCFRETRRQEEISDCVEDCSFPIVNAKTLIDSEKANFQERLQRSMQSCKERYAWSKQFQSRQSSALAEMDTCVTRSVDDNIKTLSYAVKKLKVTLGAQ